MLATAVLGIAIAGVFGYGVRAIYKSFFKAEPVCCNGGENCTCCKMRKTGC